MLGLCCCTGLQRAGLQRAAILAHSSDYSRVVGRGLLMAAASLVEHRPWGVWASGVAARGLSSYGSQALEHRLNNYGAQAELLCSM